LRTAHEKGRVWVLAMIPLLFPLLEHNKNMQITSPFNNMEAVVGAQKIVFVSAQ
jgi:hypothetical protein